MGRAGFYVGKRRIPSFVFPEGKGGHRKRIPIKTPLRSIKPEATNFLKQLNVVQHELLKLGADQVKTVTKV